MKMKKEFILSEIKRTAIDNGGKALGEILFYKKTGISRKNWYPDIFESWGEALIEAGFKPNQFGLPKLDDEHILKKIIDLIREKKDYPSKTKFIKKHKSDSEFPSRTTIRSHFGNKPQVIKKILDFCKTNDGYEDIIEICSPLFDSLKASVEGSGDLSEDKEKIGVVYLLKQNTINVYKIGSTFDKLRRFPEIKLESPYELEEIHVIPTKTPHQAETYWKKKFKDKKTKGKGEWFKLSTSDVNDFKKCKYM